MPSVVRGSLVVKFFFCLDAVSNHRTTWALLTDPPPPAEVDVERGLPVSLRGKAQWERSYGRYDAPVDVASTAAGRGRVVPPLEGAQRPNLKSEDSGFRHRFSEAKVSLWMCENGAGHEESRGPTRR